MSSVIQFVPAVREKFPKEFWVYEYRLLNRCEVDEFGCWVWQGPPMRSGYGQINAWGKLWLNHRLMHHITIGPIPEGYQVDHLCRVTMCINPAHLEAVTQAENLRRQGAAVTHCPAGHEYTPENTYRAPSTPKLRRCLTCSRVNSREYQRALRTASLAVAA